MQGELPFRLDRLSALRSGLSHADGRCRLDFDDWRRVPFAGERLRLRAVKTHAHVEWGLWRGQPVGFLLFAGTLILEIQVKRTIRVGLERHPAADGEPIEHIADLEAFAVVES